MAPTEAELVRRIGRRHHGVPRLVVAEQVVAARAAVRMFGDDPELSRVVEKIAAHTVAQVDEAIATGASHVTLRGTRDPR